MNLSVNRVWFLFQQLESQMKMKEGQVAELDEQAVILKKVDPQQESMIEARKALVAER